MSKWTLLVGAALLCGALLGPAQAADSDARASREREMLRRAQEALRQSEAEKGDLTRAKLETEQKLKELSQQLDAVRNGSKAGQAALRSQLQSAATAQADLQSKLDEANKQVAALFSKQRETAGQLATRESEIKQLQQELQTTKTTVTSCDAKNIQLYAYSQEILDRYKKKGVWTALAQKDPVFGFKEIGIENVLQEYHDKLAAQKILVTPAATAAPSPSEVPPTAQKSPH